MVVEAALAVAVVWVVALAVVWVDQGLEAGAEALVQDQVVHRVHLQFLLQQQVQVLSVLALVLQLVSGMVVMTTVQFLAVVGIMDTRFLVTSAADQLSAVSGSTSSSPRSSSSSLPSESRSA